MESGRMLSGGSRGSLVQRRLSDRAGHLDEVPVVLFRIVVLFSIPGMTYACPWCLLVREQSLSESSFSYLRNISN
jgi:hypothetical protein